MQRATNPLITPAHHQSTDFVWMFSISYPPNHSAANIITSHYFTQTTATSSLAQPPSSTVNTFGFPSRGMVPHVRGHGRVSGTGLCGQVAVDVAPLGDTNQMEIAWGIDPKKTWKQPFSSRQLFDVTMLERFFAHAIHISNGLCIWENEEMGSGRLQSLKWHGFKSTKRQLLLRAQISSILCLIFVWQMFFLCWYFMVLGEDLIYHLLMNFPLPGTHQWSTDDFPTRMNRKSPIHKNVLSEMRENSSWCPVKAAAQRPPQGQPPAPEARVPPSVSTLEALWKIRLQRWESNNNR